MDELIKALHEGAEFLECSTPGIKNSFAKMCHNAAETIEELSRENESLAKSVNEASEILRKRWIPVTERLPQETQRCIVVSKCGEMAFAIYNETGFQYPCYMGKATHWMPLPQAPEEE